MTKIVTDEEAADLRLVEDEAVQALIDTREALLIALGEVVSAADNVIEVARREGIIDPGDTPDRQAARIRYTAALDNARALLRTARGEST